MLRRVARVRRLARSAHSESSAALVVGVCCVPAETDCWNQGASVRVGNRICRIGGRSNAVFSHTCRAPVIVEVRLVINEVLQWSGILGTLLLVMGVFRQVGLLTVDSRSLTTASFGPETGESGIVPYKQRAFPESESYRAETYLALFLSTECRICDALLHELDERGESIYDPGKQLLSIIVETDDVARVTALRERLVHRFPAWHVTLRSRVVEGRGPGGFPFAILFDHNWTVVRKALGTEVVHVIANLAGDALYSRLSSPPSDLRNRGRSE